MQTFKDFEASIAKTIDSIKQHTIGVPRAEMPQLDAQYFPDFFDFLKKKGVKVKRIEVDIDKLKASQKDFSPTGVKHLLATNSEKLSKPLLISKDFYLVDGHHRWTALRILAPGKKIDAFQIDLPVRQALSTMWEFPKTRHGEHKAEVSA